MYNLFYRKNAEGYQVICTILPINIITAFLEKLSDFEEQLLHDLFSGTNDSHHIYKKNKKKI